MTCWGRLRDWQTTGVWARLHHVLLDRLGRANGVDWSHRAVDGAGVAAKRGGDATGPSTKRHLVVDAVRPIRQC
jgi:transposase